MKDAYIIGIDIGGTNFRIGAVDQNYQVHNFRKVRVKEVFCTENPLEDLGSYLETYCEELEKDGKQPEAVVIGFPATINRERSVVLQAPNIAFMENLPVTEELSHRLKLPVMIERDVSLALCYDRKRYGLEDCEILTGCYFGTGIGNAIMIRGQILLGKDGVAGEIGHIPVDGSEELCGCGNVGCMENLAGGKYLAHLCKTIYHDVDIAELFTKHASDSLLLQYVDRMAMTVATEINILNPDCMLIGGGIVGMKDFPWNYLEERIHIRTRKPYPEQELRIIYAEDEDAKSVIGGAIYARYMIEGLAIS